MLRGESSITKIKPLPKPGTLLRKRAGSKGSLSFFVVCSVNESMITIKYIGKLGSIIPVSIRVEIYNLLWAPHAIEVTDPKEKLIASLKGLIL